MKKIARRLYEVPIQLKLNFIHAIAIIGIFGHSSLIAGIPSSILEQYALLVQVALRLQKHLREQVTIATNRESIAKCMTLSSNALNSNAT